MCARIRDCGRFDEYGPSVTDNYKQLGIYVGHLLKSEKPCNLLNSLDQVRFCNQSEDGERTWTCYSASTPCTCRRGHRVISKHPHGPPMTLGNMRELGVRLTQGMTFF